MEKTDHYLQIHSSLLSNLMRKVSKAQLYIEKKITFPTHDNRELEIQPKQVESKQGDYYSSSLRGVSPACVLARSNIQLFTLNESTAEGEGKRASRRPHYSVYQEI